MRPTCGALLFACLLCVVVSRQTPTSKSQLRFESIAERNAPIHYIGRQSSTKGNRIYYRNPARDLYTVGTNGRWNPNYQRKHHNYADLFLAPSRKNITPIRRSWHPTTRTGKTKLSQRKRTARQYDNLTEDNKQTAHENLSKSDGLKADDIPDINVSMMNMKKLLEKLTKNAEFSEEENNVGISTPSDVSGKKAHTYLKEQLSSVRKDAQLTDVKDDQVSAEEEASSRASLGAPGGHHMGFKRGPVAQLRLGGQQRTAPAAGQTVAQTTAQTTAQTENFQPMKSPATQAHAQGNAVQTQTAGSTASSAQAHAQSPVSSASAQAQAQLSALYTPVKPVEPQPAGGGVFTGPDGQGGWSGTLAGFLGGGQGAADAAEDGDDVADSAGRSSQTGWDGPGGRQSAGGGPGSVGSVGTPGSVTGAGPDSQPAASSGDVSRTVPGPEPVRSAPRGPGTFYHFVNSPMTPQDGSNCTFDPMEDAPQPLPQQPQQQQQPQLQPQPQPQPLPQTQPQPLPQPLPQPQPQPLPQPQPQPLPQPQQQLRPLPLPGSLPKPETLPDVSPHPPREAPQSQSDVFPSPPPGAPLWPGPADTCPPCRCSCSPPTEISGGVVSLLQRA